SFEGRDSGPGIRDWGRQGSGAPNLESLFPNTVAANRSQKKLQEGALPGGFAQVQRWAVVVLMSLDRPAFPRAHSWRGPVRDSNPDRHLLRRTARSGPRVA